MLKIRRSRETVLSLAWESLYTGKTVFILRRGPGANVDASTNVCVSFNVVFLPNQRKITAYDVNAFLAPKDASRKHSTVNFLSSWKFTDISRKTLVVNNSPVPLRPIRLKILMLSLTDWERISCLPTDSVVCHFERYTNIVYFMEESVPNRPMIEFWLFALPLRSLTCFIWLVHNILMSRFSVLCIVWWINHWSRIIR